MNTQVTQLDYQIYFSRGFWWFELADYALTVLLETLMR